MSTKIVGILNITPDSFSDGGKFLSEENALKQLQQMLEEGADMIDIGAESTRPGAIAISAAEEIKRLEKILPKIIANVKDFNKKNNRKITIAIDSRHFNTVKFAYENGVDVINDVSGLTDEKTIEFIAKNNIKTVFMHSLSVPANPEIIINSALNVVDEIMKWAQEKIAFFISKGIKKEQLIFDPGIGFSKSAVQSIRILRNVATFKSLDIPIYIGHSKKSFLDIINIDDFHNEQFNSLNLDKNIDERSKKTIIISAFLSANGADFIRVHDVLANKKAISSN